MVGRGAGDPSQTGRSAIAGPAQNTVEEDFGRGAEDLGQDDEFADFKLASPHLDVGDGVACPADFLGKLCLREILIASRGRERRSGDTTPLHARCFLRFGFQVFCPIAREG